MHWKPDNEEDHKRGVFKGACHQVARLVFAQVTKSATTDENVSATGSSALVAEQQLPIVSSARHCRETK